MRQELLEDSPSATINDSSKRGRPEEPANVAVPVRERKPSYAMQQKQKEEMEQIEKLAEAVGEKVDEVMVDVRTNNELYMEEDQGVVEEEAARLVSSSTKVERMYERYQEMWKQYCEFHELTEERNDQMLKGFFEELKKKYAASTLWVIYSCVNAYFVEKYGTKLNSMPRLSKFLKQVTHLHVCKKSKVFTKDEIHRVLMYVQTSGCPEDTLMGVGISLMYYGLLRAVDVLNVVVSDVQVEKGKTIYISFKHQRKRKNPGFSFHIPMIYSPLFHRYQSELNPYSKKDSRYLKNFNDRTKLRAQNAGRGAIPRWITRMCEILGIPKDGYTTHAFRRSAATNLADSGVSFVNLKRHGQWASDSVVEGYIANSLPLRLEREKNLLPEDVYEKDSAARKQDLPRLQMKHPALTEEEKQEIMQDIPGIRIYLKYKEKFAKNGCEDSCLGGLIALEERNKEKAAIETAQKLTSTTTPPAKRGAANLPSDDSGSEDDPPIAQLKSTNEPKLPSKKKRKVQVQEDIQQEYEAMMERKAEEALQDEVEHKGEESQEVSEDTESGRVGIDPEEAEPGANANSFWNGFLEGKPILYKCNFEFIKK